LGHVAAGDNEKMLGGMCDVGCPDLFGQPEKAPSGAVFFMLETVGANPHAYGTLASGSQGKLLFNSAPVDDIPTLVNQCLRSESINPA
jgi:hypothetical protein